MINSKSGHRPQKKGYVHDNDIDDDDKDFDDNRTGVEVDNAVPSAAYGSSAKHQQRQIDEEQKFHSQKTSKLGSTLDQGDTSPTHCNTYSGTMDVDDLFNSNRNSAEYADRADDNESLFGVEDIRWDDDDDDGKDQTKPLYYSNPGKRLLDQDASLIPGSPFSKPFNKASNRPQEPLVIAKYASFLALSVTVGWILALILVAVWQPFSVGRLIVEIFLTLLSFFGLFWNSYFLTLSILKCFIPAEAFRSNTKYASIIPETKPLEANWLDVTIQIPIFKESLHEVMMPTLKSCISAREHYKLNTRGANCNIVICDDGMMTFLNDNFPAVEMLWEKICETKGQVVRLSKLLKHVPRASRLHLKGLNSKNVYKVLHRLIFYYHHNIGFVARSTVDRRGKCKKAGNLNSHLRLVSSASQLASDPENELNFDAALLAESHNEDGSRYIMFGNDIKLGHLICINNADSRIAESVLYKTVPEFLNDKTLGFTQHATKTINEHHCTSYYTNLLTVYTDALYQGHFLLSSILGCHPPLVGHSIFLRTEALNQVGKMRTLYKSQQWLKKMGLQFFPVDQVAFSSLQAQNRLEYWSENHVSEDFELMLHLYNLGFNGRYCAYPDCEFHQECITHTFDQESGRHRKFATGAHELVFNPFLDMLEKGIFTQLFRTFLVCGMPLYYKISLMAYLCSYSSGGAYIIVFTVTAITRLLDVQNDITSLSMFSPAVIIMLNFFISSVVGCFTFLVSLLRMYCINNKLFFPEYRKKFGGAIFIMYVHVRYSFIFQMLLHNVVCFTFYFLGTIDHFLARPGIVGATIKDSIYISRCRAFYDMARFNFGSWTIAIIMAGLAYLTVIKDFDWQFNHLPDYEEFLYHSLFAAPAMFLSLLCFIVPIILNPLILGWPFLQGNKPKKSSNISEPKRTGASVQNVSSHIKTNCEGGIEFNQVMTATSALDNTIQPASNKTDIELASLATDVITNKKQISKQSVNNQKAQEEDNVISHGIYSDDGNGTRKQSRRQSRDSF